MEATERRSLYDWVLEQTQANGFRLQRKERTESDSSSRVNGNLNLTVAEDVELLVNNGIKGVEPGYIFVPKGSALTIYRHPPSGSWH